MTDTGFRQRAETPVSIGLPLSLHSRVRDKSLVNLICDMHLGSSYDICIESGETNSCGVTERMKETCGYVLPSFVTKDKSIFSRLTTLTF